MSAELRQRKGNEAGNEARDDKDAEIARLKAELAKAKNESEPPQEGEVAKTDDEEADRETMVKEIQERLIQSVKKDVKPGMSNEAKRAKDDLQKDPFNMQLIFELGRAYAVDEQWERSANVLLRGWKRIPEVPNLEARFDFLTILCQGSMKAKKYKQALAVINDIENYAVPDEPQALRGFLVMSCQVYSHNGDMVKALKSFNKAIENWTDEFDAMLGVWVGCMPGLKKVGAFDAARSSLLMKVTTDEERSKLDTYEKLADIRHQLEAAVEPKPMTSTRKFLFGISFLIFMIVNMVFLYKIESWNLAKIRPGDK